jgi:peptidoglycan-N-acetylglucosamine deacetylase
VPVTVTYDLEDNRRSRGQPERFPSATELVLDFLRERRIRATVYVVGSLAETHPRLVSRIAEDGHEVGLHGFRHVSIETVGERRLPEELRRGKALLEDLIGGAVAGYRAPIFSLTPRTAWAIEHITSAGFAYSSSVLPASNPLNGYPGAPRRPFRWPTGLIELPCPVVGIRRASIPFLGGVYLRYLPSTLVIHWLRSLGPSSGAWTYCHPYDFDPDEPFFVLPHAGWMTSRIVHHNRGGTFRRLEHLLKAAGGAGPVLADVALAASSAPLFTPSR